MLQICGIWTASSLFATYPAVLDKLTSSKMDSQILVKIKMIQYFIV